MAVLDFDADHARQWGELTGELLTRDADRFPAPTRAIAEGAWAAAPEDPLAFGLERLLDGVQALIDRGWTCGGKGESRSPWRADRDSRR